MNAENVLKFMAAAAVIATATVVLALYENAKGMPFDQADLANAALFICAAGALAFAFMVVPKDS